MLVGAFRRRVDWRGNKLWIDRGSELFEAAPDLFEQPAEEVA